MLAVQQKQRHRLNPSEHAHNDLPTEMDAPNHRQYAYPAYMGNKPLQRNRENSMSFTDHMLRRKTPNGPIADAYDATLTDRSIQLPATKHVVLSATPEKRQAYSSTWESSLGRVQDFETECDLPERSPYPIRHVSYVDSGQALRQPSAPQQTWTDRPAWDFPGGLDSMLNQELPFHPSQRYYVQKQYGSAIPIVRPLAMQPWTAPTASAGAEKYGPYWPDGSFNPYRPAPVRDSRFHEQQINQHNAHSNKRYGGQVFDHSEQQHGVPLGLTWARGMKDARLKPLPTYHAPDKYDFETMGSGIDDRGEAHQGTTLSDFDVSKNIRPQKAFDHRFLPSPASEQFTQRESVFAWAQSIYMLLLSSIQQAQKGGQNHSNPPLKQVRRPAIYPKPPRHQEIPQQDQSKAHGGQVPMFQRNNSYPSQDQMDSAPSRPSTAIFSPSNRVGHSNDFAHGSCDSNRLQSFSDHYNDKYRTPRRPSDLKPGPTHSPNSLALVQNDAFEALHKMEDLCMNEDWVDGMLLAGCLAYGLGIYDKAMKWYQSILAHDARHVEAMSNMAATLLALNRREEALGHWTAAVKLKPSYFEAVEHLIGLLCHMNRASDAVTVIQEIEKALRMHTNDMSSGANDFLSESDSDSRSRTSSIASIESVERAHFDYETDGVRFDERYESDLRQLGFGSSGFAIPGSENGRILALIHAKGNMLYALGNNAGAAEAFEDAILIASGGRQQGVKGLIHRILATYAYDLRYGQHGHTHNDLHQPILLSPERALMTARHLFPPSGDLPGLNFVCQGMPRKAAIATTSNSLLSLAKIYQDGMSSGLSIGGHKVATGTRDILALYYLSLSLQPSPSTANNVGILLASVQSNAQQRFAPDDSVRQMPKIPGVVPESGIGLALAYYNYGLHLDKKHAHLYTNLGSLLKDIGQLDSAIKMYEFAVQCDPKFDIALANLANAVKDRGQVADAIAYYRRAVEANPEFAEAVCGLATALNSVCGWHGRGGIYADDGKRDRVHVDENGKLWEAKLNYGWMKRVIDIVERQLSDGETWGIGTLTPTFGAQLLQTLCGHGFFEQNRINRRSTQNLKIALQQWRGQKWEGARVVRLIERAIRQIGWQWYQDRYKRGKEYKPEYYARPRFPPTLTSPNAPTVLPFHTFTAPLSAKQIRQISQRNGLRISVSTLRAPWLPATVYPPPSPPRPCLNVGYVSSDFNNHPLAHLMQSVFGLHDPRRVHAVCYATTVSDKSTHRQQIEREAPVFRDVSSWSNEQLVNQIVQDNIHILVNLNGYTRGARNEVFAARAAPIHMSFMGFAGTLGAEWSDYILADAVSVPPETLSPWRRNVGVEDLINPEALAEDTENWVYSENLIFTRDTFFCCDHKQSAPDAKNAPSQYGDSQATKDAYWADEKERRWRLRKELFPSLQDDAIIFGNFNQLYKIDPATFRMYLRILQAVPNAILWLLRFPDLGEQNLLNFARDWAGSGVAGRIIFTDVAPKGMHITRASVLDLFLDTPECNAHTTAADVVWSGTPILTWGKWKYKMCSRMAGSILGSALPLSRDGDVARRELIVASEERYEEVAIRLARDLRYDGRVGGDGVGRLMELRRMLWEGRWTSRLFDTKRWVRDVESAYWAAWDKWERGEGGDIWL
jgi:predicted O-linked N-acetylglucosamine transferase (SPINDLY family)